MFHSSKIRAWGGVFKRTWLIGSVMLPLFVAIHFAAYWMRFEGFFSPGRWLQFQYTLMAVLVIKTVLFAAYGIYRGWSRYATFYDLVRLTQAVTISAVLLALFDYLFLARLHTPRSVFFMDWGATLLFVGGLRCFGRWVNEGSQLFDAARATPALLVGADQYGESILRSIRRRKTLKYNVVGFVAQERSAVGSLIAGVPVVGTIDETCDLADQYEVDEVLIAASALTGKQVRQLVDDSTDHAFAVKVLPSYDQILDGQIDLRPQRVSITDLLRREPVQLDMTSLRRWLEGQTLLVTGSAGSIGSEICKQLMQFRPARIVTVDRSENGQFFLEKDLRALFPEAEISVCLGDISDPARMTELFRQYRPDVVFHAAAYKHVPLMETNCGEAVKNIPLATKTLADLADEYAVKSFVMISTDKAVNPTSVMGCAKRVAELYVQAMAGRSACRFVTVRFGNVLGSNGSVVPIFRQQIAKGGPVTVTHPEMQRYFMMIPEASQLVIQAGAMGKGGEIFVLDMGEPVKIVDLAKDMIRLSGLRVGDDIEISFTGIRPGEKLFEELHIGGETHVATKHSKIMVVQSQQTALDEITESLRRLALARFHSNEQIVQQLKQVVPEFTPTRFAAEGLRRAA